MELRVKVRMAMMKIVMMRKGKKKKRKLANFLLD